MDVLVTAWSLIVASVAARRLWPPASIEPRMHLQLASLKNDVTRPYPDVPALQPRGASEGDSLLLISPTRASRAGALPGKDGPQAPYGERSPQPRPVAPIRAQPFRAQR